MNFNKLTKAALILECEKRGLSTEGLKDQLLRRLKEVTDRFTAEIDVQEENYDSEDEYNQNSEETLNDDENLKEPNQIPTLTDESINLKETINLDEASIIVNVNDDTATSLSNTNKESQDKEETAFDYDQPTNNRDLDNNGEHEIIEISEEIIIDDEDNHDTDNNFNDEAISNNGESQDKDELELGEARDDDSSSEKEKKNLWVHNVAEDVKAVDLKELFGKYGNVISAKIVMDGNNCFGCIELNCQDDVYNCITNLNNTEFRGNTIVISKDMSDSSSIDKIQRNISPISSSDSWGGGGDDGKKKEKSISLPAGEIVIEIKDDEKEEDEDCKSKPLFRSRGGYRGNNYGNRDNNSRNKEQESSGRDYRRTNNDMRGTYGSRQERDEPSRQNYNRDNRSRDNYPRDNYASRRELPPRGARDNYNSSRYQPINRDTRPPYRDDRPKSSRYYEDSGRSSKYQSTGNYDQDYERRSTKRVYDRSPLPRDDYHSRSTRDEISFKRPRIDNDDHNHTKRFIRREDFSPPQRGGNSRDKYRLSSPKRSFYYEKEFTRPDFRDKRESYPSSGSGRDYYQRRPTYDKYSPERRSNRGHNYKESFNTDFGGRSRNY